MTDWEQGVQRDVVQRKALIEQLECVDGNHLTGCFIAHVRICLNVRCAVCSQLRKMLTYLPRHLRKGAA